MKTLRLFQGLFAAILFVIVVVGSAQASFYIPFIYGGNAVIGGGDDNPYPNTGHFDWITTSNSYGYNTAFTYSNGDLSYQIDFTLYAPDNWNSGNTGTDYTGYRPNDDGLIRGTNATSLGGGAGAFDDVYSYFYTVTNLGTDNLETLTIDYSDAAIDDFGYVTGGGGVAPGSMTDTAGLQLEVDYGTGLTTGQSSTIYTTSESWYGWLNAEGVGPSGSANGNLPSPNPEASTVALYMVGLVGMAGYTYMKKRRAEIL